MAIDCLFTLVTASFRRPRPDQYRIKSFDRVENKLGVLGPQNVAQLVNKQSFRPKCDQKIVVKNIFLLQHYQKLKKSLPRFEITRPALALTGSSRHLIVFVVVGDPIESSIRKFRKIAEFTEFTLSYRGVGR